MISFLFKKKTIILFAGGRLTRVCTTVNNNLYTNHFEVH